jgi:hypothetical protein
VNDVVRLIVIEGLSGLLAIVSIGTSLIILLNVRGAATSIVNLSERLSTSALGILFRGEQSLGIVRLLALGLLLVGLQPIFRISVPSGAVGSAAPTDFLVVLFGWTYIGYAAVVQVRSGFRRMVPSITFLFTVLIVSAYVADAVALTSLPASRAQ